MDQKSQLMADSDAVVLLQRIQKWREELPGRPRRLPEWFWQAAGNLSQRHGSWRTAKFFRLNTSDLKRHMAGGVDRAATKERSATKSAFVELPTPNIQVQSRGVVIEFEDRKGVKLTVRGCDTRGLDLGALAASFFRKCR